MLKHMESFDHIGAASNIILYTALGWSWGHNDMGSTLVVSGVGRLGSNALAFQAETGGYSSSYLRSFSPPVIQRDCSKLILGFNVMAVGVTISVIFKHDDHHNFTISCTMNSNGTITISMVTGGADGYHPDTRWASYPTIVTSAPIPAPYLGVDYHCIELSVDVTDYHNGCAKVAVDGKTYFDMQGIVTAAWNTFGDNQFDSRSKLNGITFVIPGHSGIVSYFDSFYLADDEGGYQDDFLGDIFVKTAYPVADGTKRNWIPYANSSPLGEDYPHHELIDSDPIQPGDETEYLEADLDLTEELVGFGTDPIPAGSELIAVNHRTMFRNVATPGTPKMNSLIPLFQMQGNPIVRTDSLAKKLTGWSYAFLDVYYDIVPIFAVPWEEYLLEQTEFGFLLRNTEGFVPQVEDLTIADDVFDTEFDWDLMPEGIDFADEAIDSIGLLMLFFAGVDEATTWVEDSHDYDPDYSDGAEIDTAQFYVGSSSVKLVARDGQPSGFGYVVPGITPNITLAAFFRFHGVDDYLGIFLGDTDEGEVFLDFAIEARDGSRYYWIGAGNTGGDIGTPFTDECLLAADTWHKIKMIVAGRDISVEVNDVEVVRWTAAIDNPLSGLGYAEFQNANDVAGNDVWIGSAVIRE